MSAFNVTVLALAVLAGTLALTGFLYQRLGTWRDRRRYPPPGRLVDVGGYRLHLREIGAGHPTVVLDSALGGSSMSWCLVQAPAARVTRVCAYDRAGFGWSEPGPGARTADVMVDELHRLLHRAAIPAPYVLVGHSYGALVTLLYTAWHPEEVAGLVLVDPPDAEAWGEPDEDNRARIERGARLARRASAASRLGWMRLFFFLFGWRAAPVARLVSRGASLEEERRIFQVLEKLPAEARAVLKWLWSEPEPLRALASQIENVPKAAAAAAAAPIPPQLPLVVLSASDAEPKQKEYQERLARRSSRGKRVVASRSGHWIPLDEPDLVVEGIREVVDTARRQLQFSSSRGAR